MPHMFWYLGSPIEERYRKIREESRMQKYFTQNRIREMTQEQINEAVIEAVKDMNNWLFKDQSGEHPNSVFINYLKKSIVKKTGSIELLRSSSRRGLTPSNVLVNIENNKVTDLHFYNSNWPSYGIALLNKLRTAAISLDYRSISKIETSNSKQNNLESLTSNIISSINNFKIN